MMNIANSVVNLISGVGDQLGSPYNNSLWRKLGDFFSGFPMNILNIIWFLIQTAMKFVLNLVDLMQYFVKHLVGIDYWEGEVSLDTVGDSDVIFKFIYNTNVQRVFRYMVGVFIVLLIVFAIIAIVRNEYAVASEADKASNDATVVLKRAGKAILMVVLVPVLLVFGLLASNAILASLVNAFNINNRISLGNQVFVASSYEGNRYRLYAEQNIRYAMNNKVNVYLMKIDEATTTGEGIAVAQYYMESEKAKRDNSKMNDGEDQTYSNLTAEQVSLMKNANVNIASKQITVSMTPVNPRDYGGSNYFTGFAFTYKDGKTYLWSVPESELTCDVVISESEQFKGAQFYYYYLTQMLGVKKVYTNYSIGVSSCDLGELGLVKTDVGYVDVSGYVIKAKLHDYDDDTAIIQAAYNSWNYNSMFLDDQRSFENTQKKIKDVFVSDSGRTYANAVHYTNNEVWGILHDGGYTGNYVALRDEYYVMADVLDFMMSESLQLAIVNINNPYIKWDYASEGGYLKTTYVNAKKSDGTITGMQKFAVNYVNDGIVTYYNNGELLEESKGAIYIIAYYNGSEYIPLVNNAEYTDAYGSYTFSSSYLEDDYNGLVVARGILQGTWNNLSGFPSEISTEYVYSSTGEVIDLETPYYYDANLTPVNVKAEKVLDYEINYVNYGGLDKDTGVQSHVLQSGTNGSLTDVQINMIRDSLPNEIAYTTYYSHTYIPDGETDPVTETGADDVVLNDVEWLYSGHVFTFNSDADVYYLFIADQGIQSYIENENIYVDTEGRDLPLYCFVNVDINGKTTLIFAYGQYNKEDLGGTTDYVNWFSHNGQTNLTLQHDADVAYLGGIYGNYFVQGGTNGSGLIARAIPFNVNASALGGTVTQDEKTYKNSLVTINSFTLPTVKNAVDDETNNGYLRKNASIVNNLNNKFASEINGNKTRFSYPVSVVKLFNPVSAAMFVKPKDMKINDGTLSSMVSSVVVRGTTAMNESYLNNCKFAELPGTREEFDSGVVNYYYAMYSVSDTLDYYTINGVSGQVIKFRVTVTPSDDGNTMNYSLYVYDTFKLLCGGNVVGIANNPSNPFYFNLYDDCKQVAKNGEKITYTYSPTVSDNYYLYLNHSVSAGKETYDAVDAYQMIKGEMKVYNKYTYELSYTHSDSNINQYNFNYNKEKEESAANPQYKAASELKTITFLADPASTSVAYSQKNNEGKYDEVIILKNNKETVARFNVILDAEGQFDTAQLISDNLKYHSTVFKYEDEEYYKLTSLTNEKVPLYELVTGSIVFKNQRVPTSGKFKLDLKFELFGVKRLNISWWGATGAADNERLGYYIKDGIFSLDYNFSDPQHQVGLGLQTYFLPLKTNIVILIFASILLIKVLGQAVWGLIQRIFDITLYFVILPGVAATMPLDDGGRFKTWKDNVIKKVLGAYGVLIGINFFFIILPAIRSASKLFSGTDLKDNLATGNIFANVSPDFVNYLVYVMFMLVALTMIQTLPAIIAQFVGGSDSYSEGAKVKKTVSDTIDTVGNAVSGTDLIKGVENTKKTFKEALPGSAFIRPIIDTFKKGKEKGAGEGKGDEESTAADESQETQQGQNAAAENQQSEAANENQEAAAGENATGDANAENAEEKSKGVIKDEEKLAELEEEKQRQLNGENSTRLGIFARNKAYKNYNEGKGLEDSIIDENNKEVQAKVAQEAQQEYDDKLQQLKLNDKMTKEQAMEAMWKESVRKGEISDISSQEDKELIKQQHLDEWNNLQALKNAATDTNSKEFSKRMGSSLGRIKDEVALAVHNKQTGENLTMEQFNKLGVRAKDKIREEFKQDQANKMAEARNNYINDKLDNKIAKVKQRIAEKEAGVYRNWFQKGAGFLTGRVMRKTTENDIEKLNAKKAEAEERLQKAIDAKDEKAIKREQNAINKLNDRINQKHQGLLPFITASARSGIRRASADIMEKYGKHKDEKIAENLRETKIAEKDLEREQDKFNKRFKWKLLDAEKLAAEKAGVTIGDDAKFTQEQFKRIGGKFSTMTTNSKDLEQTLKKHGLTLKDLQNEEMMAYKLNKSAFAKDKNLDMNSKKDVAKVKAQTKQIIAEIKNKQSEVEKSTKDYAKEITSIMKENQQSFAKNNIMAKRASYNRVKARRSAMINELNKLKKKRGDGPETDEEKKLINDIAGADKQLEELSHYTKFGRVKDNAKFVGGKVGHAVNTGVTWTRKKWDQGAHLVAQGAAGVAHGVKWTGEKIGAAGKTVGHAIGTAATATGHAIGTAATATGHAIGTAGYFVGKYTGVNAIANKVRREKAAKVFIQSDEVKERTKARSSVKEDDLAKRVAERVAERQKSTPANVAQIRKTAKEQINEVLKNAPPKYKGSKSASGAYKNGQEYRKFADAAIREFRRMEARNGLNPAQKREFASLQAQINRLKQIEDRLNSQAKKMGKDVKTLMSDRRSAKYKLPKIKDTRNPDPQGK